MLEELDGVEVLVPAVLVRYPLTVALAVVQIQHGGDCIDPDTVDVELTVPEKDIGNEEVLYLRLFIVKDLGTPVGMLSLSGIGMLENALSVESSEAVGVGRKMGGYPV